MNLSWFDLCIINLQSFHKPLLVVSEVLVGKKKKIKNHFPKKVPSVL